MNAPNVLRFGVACVLLFIVISTLVSFAVVEQWDMTVMQRIEEWRSDEWNSFFVVITEVGGTLCYAVVALLAVLFLAVKRKWGNAGFVLLSVLGAWLLNTILKLLFARVRPDVTHLVEADGYSFPSGNAMVSLALYGFVAYLIILSVRQFGVKLTVVGVTVVLLALIGISRVYLGVHYPTDIVAGYAAGGFWLSVCVWISQVRTKR